MLDVRKLQALQAVARHGSITAAARSLHFTAPAVSQQLAALERETEATLFERTGRSIRLTDTGVLLAAHADIVLAQIEAASAALAGGRPPSGPLRLAAFPTAIAGVLAPALLELHRGNPMIEATVTEAEPEVSERLLRTGQIDAAIVHSYDLVPRSMPSVIQSVPLFDEPMLLVRPAAAATNASDPIDLATLGHERWIVPAVGSSCYELVQRACGAAGFVPTIAAQCIDYASTLALVRAGLGIALVPALALDGARTDNVHVRTTMVPLRRYVSLFHPAGRATDAVQLLVDVLHAGAVHRASRAPLVG